MESMISFVSAQRNSSSTIKQQENNLHLLVNMQTILHRYFQQFHSLNGQRKSDMYLHNCIYSEIILRSCSLQWMSPIQSNELKGKY